MLYKIFNPDLTSSKIDNTELSMMVSTMDKYLAFISDKRRDLTPEEIKKKAK